MDQARHGMLHHVELWVPDLDRATISWDWLLGELGYEIFQEWPGGRSWRNGPTYIVIEQSPARTATRHDRCRPGLNHVAFHVESQTRTDELSVDAGQHGWRMLFADQYPYAGGTGHYAAYLENIDGFEVELVAPSEVTAEPPAAGAGTGQAQPAAGWQPATAPVQPASAQGQQPAGAAQGAFGGAPQSREAPPAGSA